VRRNHETNLLAVYAEELTNCGIENIDSETLRQRYRAHLVYPFEAMVVSLAVGE
jgi:hypothetical protein